MRCIHTSQCIHAGLIKMQSSNHRTHTRVHINRGMLSEQNNAQDITAYSVVALTINQKIDQFS